MSQLSRLDLIKSRLKDALQPTYLEVINESGAHQGHAGYSDGASHFAVIVSAPALQGLSRVAQHRKINDALSDLLQSGAIHALRIVIRVD